MGVSDVGAAGVFVELGYNALHNSQPPLIHLTIHRRLCTTSPPPIIWNVPFIIYRCVSFVTILCDFGR